MYLPLDGPSLYGAASITEVASELRVGSLRLEGRIVVTMQPLNGDIYIGFNSSTTAITGTKVFKGQYFSIEAGDKETVWLVAEIGQTVDVRISERG